MNRETVLVTMYADTLEKVRENPYRCLLTALQEISDLNPRPIQPGDWIINTSGSVLSDMRVKVEAMHGDMAIGWSVWPSGFAFEAWARESLDDYRLCAPEEIPAQYPAWLDKVGVKT